MVDVVGTVRSFFDAILQNPVYLLVTIGAIALVFVILFAWHIHQIHGKDLFVHQAWGANWKGR